MIAGRDFDERDRLGAERVVIVNEAFQRRFAPDGSVVGARMTAITEGFTIIGLTADVPDRSLREAPAPLVMAPLAQMPAGNITWTALTFVLRTAERRPAPARTGSAPGDLGHQSQHRDLRDGHDGRARGADDPRRA